MIPPFTASGLLPRHPDGRGYECSAEDVRLRFVDDLGSPAWRVSLFEGWDEIRSGLSRLVPEARWWLWGCFVSNHAEPLFESNETLDALALLPVQNLPVADSDLSLLSAILDPGRAQRELRVDLAVVYQHAVDHPAHLDSIDSLEFKWRPRAVLGIADHVVRELEPAGFVEVLT